MTVLLKLLIPQHCDLDVALKTVCCWQGAALLAQHAAENVLMDLEGTALRSSHYLAFGATGALLRWVSLSSQRCRH